MAPLRDTIFYVINHLIYPFITNYADYIQRLTFFL
jgi:hypothetical protein